MNNNRINLIEFLDTQIRDTKAKIFEKRIDRVASAYGQGRLDALVYIKKCLKDSSTLDDNKEDNS